MFATTAAKYSNMCQREWEARARRDTMPPAAAACVAVASVRTALLNAMKDG
jgi:hypothetical protein